jgi:hypothetical protein
MRLKITYANGAGGVAYFRRGTLAEAGKLASLLRAQGYRVEVTDQHGRAVEGLGPAPGGAGRFA